MSVRITDLTITVGGRTILKSASIAFEDKKCYAVIGPNGAGKTTLLLSALNLAPVKLPEDKVFIDDRKIEHYSRKTIARKIALVPQRRSFSTSLSVRKVVEMGYFPYSTFMYSYYNTASFERAVDSLGLRPLLDRNVLALSAGELQRVMIARALYQDTKYVFIDEPEENLDIKGRYELVGVLNKFKDTRCFVIACHDINMGLALADVVVLMKGGRIVDVITEKKLLTQKKLEELYEVKLSRVRVRDNDYYVTDI